MRIWTLHPKHLDPPGLVALWREGLLAQKVLAGKTKGYRNHSQLIRFKESHNPLGAMAAYLTEIYKESTVRGYKFDRTKILKVRTQKQILETKGQLDYEWKHLKRKLRQRNPSLYRKALKAHPPEAHPLFKIIAGERRDWEVVS